MFFLPTLIKRQSGEQEFQNGIFIRLPMELTDKYRIESYRSLIDPGWHKMDFGYHSYVHRAANGNLYIFPALMLSGIAKPTRMFHGYRQFIDREQVENTAEGIVKFEKEISMLAQDDLNLLVHDLRGLSSAIYNQALEANRFLETGNTRDAIVRVNNVLATQGMLKMRTDALDFLSNPASVIYDTDIAIYKKVDKVVRCFKSFANDQGKGLDLYGSSQRVVHGPDIFELIPYTLLDNALKYAPARSSITVFVTESAENTISVRSLGPKIKGEEVLRIFERGTRGDYAIASKVPGNGIGLNVLRQVVDDRFRGRITINQSEIPQTFDEIDYFHTDFIVSIPDTSS